jgi:SAM-dependent methyltransferase
MPVEGFDNQVVLDFGCGPGHDLVGFSVYSKPKKLIGIDISPSSLAEAEARLKLHNSPAKLVRLDPAQTRLPFEDESFDHIHTSGVLHHAPNLDVLLGELRRILKPGGTMNVMVYNYDSLWMHLFVAYHKRIVEQRYADLTLREAFTKTTDGEDCPIADCYTPSEFVTLVRRNGFEGKLTGVAISMHELIIAPARFAAIQDPRLPEECRRFLISLKADEHGYPTYNGNLAGLDACYRLQKAT